MVIPKINPLLVPYLTKEYSIGPPLAHKEESIPEENLFHKYLSQNNPLRDLLTNLPQESTTHTLMTQDTIRRMVKRYIMMVLTLRMINITPSSVINNETPYF